ncbi:glycosyltransferase [Paenibacillus hamazuiensis]|uniref:glycosyltransferase n=1 Tax=Paenibacillus hamazuiensis TaxID=2936508 RepID=UPI00200ECDA5
MPANKSFKYAAKGVSIITCTKRAEYIHNLFANYARQRWSRKELIVIINNDRIKIDPYREMARKYKNVSVYRLPGKVTLGSCMNFGVAKAKYGYIAKFDDDDFYSPRYLPESIRLMRRKKADLIGKRAHYVWLSGNRVLILRFPREEHKFVKILPGATLIFKKSVCNRVRFHNVNVGEDDQFCRDSKAKGYKIYSGGRFNFAAFRRKHSRNHTWIISEKTLLSSDVRVVRGVKNYKRYVTR